ncbi:MAG: nucleotidyltransferase family protein [Bacteroidales bacterium]|nr:nucleotidyltransferase family protein [Bacteroidales bacterium]MCM1147050.1 nucleotidyltransferase family protein [Bacteroidales bacterium]MCM1205817.1 nucleotidyltransferase family protein [Bacillota bacterium]MCM1509939.1 nucleotidyltransferase family protein [Clostridium sp.]
MNKIDTLFLELLQVAVRRRTELSSVPTPEEWEQLYAMARKQTMSGIAFAGVESLPAEQLPLRYRLIQWKVVADRLVARNGKVSACCRILYERFRKAGFHAMVLKGQGNLCNYPSHLRQLRMPGDIDVFVYNDTGHSVRDVIKYCTSFRKGRFIYYHNLDWPVFKDIPVEVHYRPTWLFSPLSDVKLQKWFRSHRSVVEYDGYGIPAAEFNVVFQLLHMYKHIFEEGIGLRQLFDYCCLLEKLDAGICENDALLRTLQELGLLKFAGAVMYVLREVFMMPEHNMLCIPCEREGRMLLADILHGGNFGRYDSGRKWHLQPDSDVWTRVMYAWQKSCHNFRYFRSYPEEVLWEPPFRLYHWFWRTFRLWRFC